MLKFHGTNAERNQTKVGLKGLEIPEGASVSAKKKSDQGGIERQEEQRIFERQRAKKSDQGGIESSAVRGRTPVPTSFRRKKSDQGGIESIKAVAALRETASVKKSDQGGIERTEALSDGDAVFEEEIRPRWD